MACSNIAKNGAGAAKSVPATDAAGVVPTDAALLGLADLHGLPTVDAVAAGAVHGLYITNVAVDIAALALVPIYGTGTVERPAESTRCSDNNAARMRPRYCAENKCGRKRQRGRGAA